MKNLVAKLNLEAVVSDMSEGLRLRSSRSLMAELVSYFLPMPLLGVLRAVWPVFQGTDTEIKKLR